METNNHDEERALFPISKSFLRECAEEQLDIKLTPYNLETIEDELMGYIYPSILECITDVVRMSELEEQSEIAKLRLPHYVVKWRNPNAYQETFVERFCFETKEDACEYIRLQGTVPEEEWKVDEVS